MHFCRIFSLLQIFILHIVSPTIYILFNVFIVSNSNKLEISTVEEDIFQLEENSENGSDTDSDEETAAATDESQLTPIAGVKAIVWVDQILKLLRDINGTVCKHSFCTGELQYTTKFCGSALVIKWKCGEKYHPSGTWCSQPKLRGMYAGNLQLAAGIVVSGNSFTKTGQLFKSMNLKCISKDTFFRVQKLYVAPAVEEMWEKMQETLFSSLKDKEVVVSGDARNDSPGHSAQYCTYTMMEESGGKVLHMEIVDVREAAGKSPNMEKIGFTRSMDFLMERINVKEVVTDGHIQIAALMRNCSKYEGIIHQNDVWPGSKSLTKMLTKAAKAKENKAILEWMPAIRKHFWFSSSSCDGDEKKLKASLLGILHHVVNEHEWALGAYGFPGKCAHEEIDEGEHDKAWLTKGSAAHKTLGRLLTGKRFMKKLAYYRNFRHTGNLESFHNHLLMYAPKQHSYGYVGFATRSKLAAIDSNYHADREQAVTKDGHLRYRCKYSKRTRNFHAEPLREAKSYGYIADLMRSIAALASD
ncbi:uncharacterized protein [Apostichopus japonicus]|uniref:uncharacterized protein n=1 Tax=Stichopus japonicus TaxID=307972 RepID=UPI003AB1E559